MCRLSTALIPHTQPYIHEKEQEMMLFSVCHQSGSPNAALGVAWLSYSFTGVQYSDSIYMAATVPGVYTASSLFLLIPRLDMQSGEEAIIQPHPQAFSEECLGWGYCIHTSGKEPARIRGSLLKGFQLGEKDFSLLDQVTRSLPPSQCLQKEELVN